MENNLKKTREELGISALQLSKASGISRMAIYKIESGISLDVKPTTMKKLADALGKNPTDIFLI